MKQRPGNPFPGLRPFRADEEPLFFGREAHVDRMVDALGATGFLAVVGSSGSGKSSLVTCGLVPALHRGLLASRPGGWRVATCRPGNRPIRALAQALAAALPPPAGAGTGFSAAGMVEATLRASKRGLLDAWQEAGIGGSGQPNLLIVADQFEELFRYRGLADAAAEAHAAEAVAFVNLLLEVAAQPADAARPLAVVLTMRSDFLGECAQFHGLPEAINRGQFLVPRMTRDERRAAVRGPLAVCGADIDPVLLNRLVNDVGDNPDQLSILQHALNRTWARWQARGATGPVLAADYDAIGTMEQALDRHADEALATLTAPGQAALCEAVFRAITDRGTDARGTRRPTRLDTLQAITGAGVDALAAVMAPFRDPSRAFLMPPDGVPLEPGTPVDISHESLMRVWTTLRRWTEAEAQSARIYRRLAETAALHADKAADLLGPPELQVALTWRTREQPNRVWAERYSPGFDAAMAFLDASQRRMQWRRRVAWGAGLAAVVLFGVMFKAAADRELAAQKLLAVANGKAEARERDAAARAEAEVRRLQADLQAQRDLIAALSKAEPQSAAQLQKLARQEPARPQVYLQFADERQRADMERLRLALQQDAYDAPPAEKVRSVPSRNELRYFRQEDRDDAARLVQVLQAAGVRPLEAKLVDTATALRRQQFELWLALPSDSDPLSRLAAQIAADDKDQRLQALQTLKDQHAGSPDAIAAVLALLGPDRLGTLSPEGRFNALWFLARTQPAAWTPGLAQTGREATARLRERARLGIAIGQQTASELASLEQLLQRLPG